MHLAKVSEESPSRVLANSEAARTVADVGRRVRDLRTKRGMTLQALADMVELSPSMLSLVERGLTSPSLSSLAAMAQGLGISLTDLITGRSMADDKVIVRQDDQPVLEQAVGVVQRVAATDEMDRLSISTRDYAPGTGVANVIGNRPGREYAVMVEGELTVETEGVSYVARQGDMIVLRAHRAYRVHNHGRRPARAVWFCIEQRD